MKKFAPGQAFDTESLVAEGPTLTGLIKASIADAKKKEQEVLAARVSQAVMAQVNALRQARVVEKLQKAKLDKMNEAILEYEKTGDTAVLNAAGLR